MLLNRFGPNRDAINPQYPFWRLKNDGVWEISQAHLVGETVSGDARVSDLRKWDIRGGLLTKDHLAFSTNPSLAYDVAYRLASSHFPDTLVGDVLDATLGRSYEIDIDENLPVVGKGITIISRRQRDSKFRHEILIAYGNRCAVCKYAVSLGGSPLALEAAHIQWHMANGPDTLENGLSLCSLHHSLFDKGAFTLSPELTVEVSPMAQGEGVDFSLYQYAGKELLAPPKRGYPRPKENYLKWHEREVFKIRDALHPAYR